MYFPMIMFSITLGNNYLEKAMVKGMHWRPN
uniref:Uncharacterized protein n=1 Tax=Arundo donax TaxID=35708 RepID=A0A0A9AKF8_ARUDO